MLLKGEDRIATRKVVVIGAGGHAKVIIDILLADPSIEIAGCTSRQQNRMCAGVPVLGDDSILPELYYQGVRHAFIAIGDNRMRYKLSLQTAAIGFQPVNAVSPRAYVAQSASLGAGIAVMPGAVINAEASIMDYAIINTNASVDHECEIGRFCHIAPGSALSGNVKVGEGSFLGTGTSVIDGISIGSWTTVGAGSTVVRPLPSDCVAYGVPAKVIRQTPKP
ncbi:acetyltransferase [Paenibacillus protaetiae]|uniref:Acetyltransferase n=1 Tax=Paenibacillus protaetiae TaxID=2509456 RepID=A0A4P6EV67_9BACL|nr:acetyltransferase [Paenibacillus protaetiae]QAY65549.1 acetyltransferase [Paenibacillus protaetiae]